jgi:hypothetical protein
LLEAQKFDLACAFLQLHKSKKKKDEKAALKSSPKKKKILLERQNMHEIIILKKILRLNSKSVCAELLDSFLAFAPPLSTMNGADTKHVEINLKNYSIIVEGDDLSLEQLFFSERKIQI